MAEGGAVVAETRPPAEKCFHFHQYDFMNDKQFMKGWETISKTHADKEVSLESRLTTAKLFYYSRFIEQISMTEYTAWLKEFESKQNSKETSPGARGDEDEEEKDGEAAVQHATDESNGKTDCGEVEQPHNNSSKCSSGTDTADDADLVQSSQEDSFKPSTEDIMDNIKMVVADDDDDDDTNEESIKEQQQQQQQQPQYPTSFLEVMELVQAGQKIPGLEDVHVEPTNQPPTEPSAAQVKKPWEA